MSSALRSKMPSLSTKKQPSAEATVHTSRNLRSEEIGLLRKPVHSLKRLRTEVNEPKPTPKVDQPAARSRRIVEMRPSSLVNEVQKSQGKRSRQIAEELTVKYDLRPAETRSRVNEVRVARQSRRAFATEIRRHLRLDADEEGRRQFLSWLEEECAQAEGEESDEMV